MWCLALYLTRMAGNDFDADSICCTLLFSVLKMPYLSSLVLGIIPIICIRSDFWIQAGLAVPSDELISTSEWIPVLAYLRAGPYVPAHELRLMFIGDG